MAKAFVGSNPTPRTKLGPREASSLHSCSDSWEGGLPWIGSWLPVSTSSSSLEAAC